MYMCPRRDMIAVEAFHSYHIATRTHT